MKGENLYMYKNSRNALVELVDRTELTNAIEKQICHNEQATAQLLNAINRNNDACYETASDLMGGLTHINNTIGQALKKKKRKAMDYVLVRQHGGYAIVTYYDDNTTDLYQIIDGMGLEHQFYNLKFMGKEDNDKYYLIKSNNVWICGNKNRLSSSSLYNDFIKSGVYIRDIPSKTKVQNAMYKYFYPYISGAQDEIIVDGLSGWSGNGKYYHANNYEDMIDNLNLDVPVKYKRLMDVQDNIEEIYTKCLKIINNKEDRLLIAIAPFYAILESLLKKEGLSNYFCINLINVDGQNRSKLASFLKVLNADRMDNYSVGMTKKNYEKLLYNSRDELMVFDVCSSTDNGSAYEKNKPIKAARKLADLSTGEQFLEGINSRDVGVAIAFISNQALNASNIVDIFITKENCNLDRLGNYTQNLAGVFSSFIHFCEDNYVMVMNLVKMHRNTRGRDRALDIVYDVVKVFFKYKGIDIKSVLETGDKVEWSEIVKDISINGKNDLIEGFVEGFRKVVGVKYKVVKKKVTKSIRADEIIIDNKYAYLSKYVLEDILKLQKIDSYKMILLETLKQNKHLETEKIGYCSRLCINGDVKKRYKINLSLFEKVGLYRVNDIEGR